MSVTIRPTIYKLTLACGHTQLTSRPLKVGTGYPCWTACDREHSTNSYVTEVERHDLSGFTVGVTAVDVNNSEMREVQLLVDEANTGT